MKKSINIGVFNPNNIYTASPYPGDQVFAKGLEKNGYEVHRLDYREEVDPNQSLLTLAEKIKPNLFWFGKCELIQPGTIKTLKVLYPGSIFIKWAADVRNEPTEHDLAHNQYIDYFFGTFGGEYLKKHLLPTMKGVASIITFTDEEFYTVKMKSKYSKYFSDVLWTGRRGFGDNDMRNEVIDSLIENKDKYDIKVFGVDNEWLGDPEYLYYITGTKIGIGVNSFNRPKYSSDRLGNYMSCGTFYLAHYFEGIEKVFKRGKDLDWFKTVDEMWEEIKYYLKHKIERKKIAKRGSQFVRNHFDSKPLVGNLLHIIKTGKSKNSWDDVFLN